MARRGPTSLHHSILSSTIVITGEQEATLLQLLLEIVLRRTIPRNVNHAVFFLALGAHEAIETGTIPAIILQTLSASWVTLDSLFESSGAGLLTSLSTNAEHS